MSSRWGMVRSALHMPPGPVVSCPMMPYSSGMRSSRWRAFIPPTRIWVMTKSVPSSSGSSRPPLRTATARPERRIIRSDSPAITASRSGSMSVTRISLTGSSSGDSASSPSMSSGV